MGSDYGTIRIPRPKYNKHNERRKEMGVTWLEYIEGNAPEQAILSEEDKEEIAKEIGQQASEAFGIDGLDEEIVVGKGQAETDIERIERKLESIHKDIEQLPQQNAEKLQQYMGR